MQTRNLGFTCFRLDPETYKLLTEICQKRGIKSHQAIDLAFKIATTLTRNADEYLTAEGQEAVKKILGT